MAPKTNSSEEILNIVDSLVMPTRGNQASKGENAEQPEESFIADLVVASSGDTTLSFNVLDEEPVPSSSSQYPLQPSSNDERPVENNEPPPSKKKSVVWDLCESSSTNSDQNSESHIAPPDLEAAPPSNNPRRKKGRLSQRFSEKIDKVSGKIDKTSDRAYAKVFGEDYSKRECSFVITAGSLFAFNSGFVNGSCMSGLLSQTRTVRSS
jgi:hypothetical protein